MYVRITKEEHGTKQKRNYIKTLHIKTSIVVNIQIGNL